MNEVHINAEEFQRVATNLKTTLYNFQKDVERLDSAFAGMMAFAETFIDRLEKVAVKFEPPESPEARREAAMDAAGM